MIERLPMFITEKEIYHKLHIETQKFPGGQNVPSKMSYAFVIAVFCSMFHRKGVRKKKKQQVIGKKHIPVE